MSVSIIRNRIRLAVDNVLSRGASLSDLLTGKPLAIWQAEDVQVEVGIFSSGVFVDTLTNFTSVTLELKDSNNLLGAPLLTQTITTTAGANGQVLTYGTTSANWIAGSTQPALFVFSSADTNIELQGYPLKNFVIYLWGTTNDSPSRRIPLGSGLIQLLDSGYGDVGSIIILPPGARMSGGKLQVICPDNSKYYDCVVRLQNGSPTLSSEGNGVT